MSQQLHELCTHLVEIRLGEIAASVFAVLAEHGRSSFSTLQRLSRLPQRRLKTTLAILIQHQIVLFASSDYDDSSFFAVDWYAAYVLVRSKKILGLVRERHGESAAALVQNILQIGHASVADLVEEYKLADQQKRDSGLVRNDANINGITGNRQDANGSRMHSTSNVHGTLRSLLQDGFLIKVTKRSFLPVADLHQQINDLVIASEFPDGKVTGPKKQQDFRAAVSRVKRQWQAEDEYQDDRDALERGGVKRARTAPTSNKRQKVNGGYTTTRYDDDEDEDEEISGGPRLPDDMVVRVNHEKCVQALRSRHLQMFARRYLGNTTGSVYGAFLRTIEDSTRATRDIYGVEADQFSRDEDDEDHVREPTAVARDSDVYKRLDPKLELTTIGSSAMHSSMTNGLTNGTHNEEHESYAARNERMRLMIEHLQTLSEHPMGFLDRPISSDTSKIDLPSLHARLIHFEMDKMIKARFTTHASRIVRMLREKGKLEEKTISGLALMPPREVRAILTKLQFHGLAEVQELPKDNSRQPSRTMYLWFFDDKRVAAQFLQQTYQAMTRCLQRCNVERETKYKAVIEKAEMLGGGAGRGVGLGFGSRGALAGEEEQQLSNAEKDMLRQWRDVEDRFATQVARLDDLVALLRDFDGEDTSLNT